MSDKMGECPVCGELVEPPPVVYRVARLLAAMTRASAGIPLCLVGEWHAVRAELSRATGISDT